MPEYLCATLTFLGGAFHGRADGGEPEWPPSPLRFFQALVAAAAARWRDEFEAQVGPALRWLEAEPAPTIVAPQGQRGAPYRLSVPNNAMDIVARALGRGGELSKDASPATHRAMKTVRPTHVDDDASVHYLWPIAPGQETRALMTACEGVSAVGWGVDLVAACVRVLSQEQADALEGHRWQPTSSGRVSLRVPETGTLSGLVQRHAAFLGRLTEGGTVLTPVPPLTAYRVQGYRRADDPAPLPFAAFLLLRPDNQKTAFFDTCRRTIHVAGMMRHAVAQAAEAAGRSGAWRATYVLGHEVEGGRARGGLETRRFSYLPLPSILHYEGQHRLSGVQRVMVAAPAGDEAEVAWLRRTMSGRELIDEQGQQAAVLSLLPNDDWAVRQYTGQGRVWKSVTPVILPGRDDGRPAKTERLLRRSLEHAGLPTNAALSWRREGYWPGANLATCYTAAACHTHPVRYHVRMEWPEPVKGPVAVGAGRYGGMGVFALDSSEPSQ